MSSQSQYDQSIWPVTFKATCVSPLIFKIISAHWRHLVLRNVTWGKCTTSWKGYLWSDTTTMLIIICWWCDRRHLGVRWKCRTVLVLNQNCIIFLWKELQKGICGVFLQNDFTILCKQLPKLSIFFFLLDGGRVGT